MLPQEASPSRAIDAAGSPAALLASADISPSRRRRNSIHDHPSLESLRVPASEGPAKSPKRATFASVDFGGPTRGQRLPFRRASDVATSHTESPDPGWSTPLSSVSPVRRSISGPSPSRASPFRPRVSPRPTPVQMRSEAGRRWAQSQGLSVEEQITSSKASSGSSEGASVVDGLSRQRLDLVSDLTPSTRPTSRSKASVSPSPDRSRPLEQTRSASARSFEARVAGTKSRMESWYEEDTPRKPSPAGRPNLFSRLSHRREVSDVDASRASPQPLGSLHDARSMTKIDIFLLATKLQAELETTQKQAALEKEALLDALHESREVVADLRTQRDNLQSGRGSVDAVGDLRAMEEERDLWRARAEEARRMLRDRETENANLQASLTQAREQVEDLSIQNGRLQTRVNSMANELKRAVVDLRSASAMSLNTLAEGGGSDARSTRSSIRRKPSHREAPEDVAKERTPSLASTGPAFASVNETPIAGTTFKFAPSSGVTPLAIRAQGLPLPIPGQGRSARTYLPHRLAKEIDSDGDEHEPESPTSSPLPVLASMPTSPPVPPISSFKSDRDPGSPTSTVFEDHNPLRGSMGSVGSGSLGLTLDDERFLADLDSMSMMADTSFPEDNLSTAS